MNTALNSTPNTSVKPSKSGLSRVLVVGGLVLTGGIVAGYLIAGRHGVDAPASAPSPACTVAPAPAPAAPPAQLAAAVPPAPTVSAPSPTVIKEHASAPTPAPAGFQRHVVPVRTLSRYSKPLAPRSTAVAPAPDSPDGQARLAARKDAEDQARRAAIRQLATNARVTQAWLASIEAKCNTGELPAGALTEIKVQLPSTPEAKWQRIIARDPKSADTDLATLAAAEIDSKYWAVFGDEIIRNLNAFATQHNLTL
jgi:hypothetical protein